MNETECRFCEKQAGDTGTCEMINWCRQDVRACDHYVPQKKIYFKLPPELVDGEHWTVVEKISTVQDAGPMTLEESIAHVEGGFRSNMGIGMAEGLVLRAPLGLCDHNGSRLIVKVKTRDFVRGMVQ